MGKWIRAWVIHDSGGVRLPLRGGGRPPGDRIPLGRLAGPSRPGALRRDLHAAYQVRAIWFLALVASLAVILTLGIPFYPYPSFRQSLVGQPEVQVQVTASQYAWKLEPDSVPAGRVVEFDVASNGVNHDFAIYDPDNRLDGQVQAMPGYTNRLFLKFSKPGSYLIRCLEYCGIAHTGMLGKFSVTG